MNTIFCVQILCSVLEDSGFYSCVLAEVVTTAILKYTSFHSDVPYEQKKLNLLNKLFLSEQCENLQQLFKVESFGLDTGPVIVLLLDYCPVDNTLLKVSPEIRFSGVSSRYCCYGNHAAGSKPI